MKCNKKIKHTMRDMGIIGTSICDKPVHEAGMCLGHYNAWQRKLVFWGQRKEYREATMDDLLKGRSVKLKLTNVHNIFRCLGGKMKRYSSKENKYVETDYPVDNNLFCVKI